MLLIVFGKNPAVGFWRYLLGHLTASQAYDFGVAVGRQASSPRFDSRAKTVFRDEGDSRPVDGELHELLSVTGINSLWRAWTDIWGRADLDPSEAARRGEARK